MDRRFVLTAREKLLCARVYNRVLALELGKATCPKGPVREKTAWFLGVSKNAIAGVISTARATQGRFDGPPSARGKPPLLISDEMLTDLAAEYRRLLEDGAATRADDGIEWLKEKHGVEVSKATILRRLQDAGFGAFKGEKHAIRETDVTVRYRHWFAEEALSHVNSSHTTPKKKTLVYLDESHVAGPSRGAGRRLNVIGAFAVSNNRGKPMAEWVPGAVQWWDANAEKPKKHGKVKSRALDDNGHDDFHGNFDVSLFNKYFATLCETLKARYGECVIFMDAATYHVGKVDPPPPQSKTEQDLAAYLQGHGVTVPEQFTKKDLVPLMEPFWKRAARRYSYETAADYGHKVIITPPCQPESNPVESLLVVVKNHVAQASTPSFSSLSDELRNGFKNHVTEKSMIKSWRKAISWTSAQLDADPATATGMRPRIDRDKDLLDYMGNDRSQE